MAEKKGNTEKLKYPFNDAGCLEVEYKPGTWIRVTPREFRSYNCPRRISQTKGKEYVTEKYEGPIYLFETNHVVDKDILTKNGLIFSNDVDPRQFKNKRAFGGI